VSCYREQETRHLLRDASGLSFQIASVLDHPFGDRHQPAPIRQVTDDLRVVLDVGGRRNGVDEEADVILAAGLVERTNRRSCVGQRDRIRHFTAVGDRAQRFEDERVARPIERLWRKFGSRDRKRRDVHERSGQDGLLGVFGIERFRHATFSAEPFSRSAMCFTANAGVCAFLNVSKSSLVRIVLKA
jgi:hypothetical protein